jgi:hypothetical protein
VLAAWEAVAAVVADFAGTGDVAGEGGASLIETLND